MPERRETRKAVLPATIGRAFVPGANRTSLLLAFFGTIGVGFLMRPSGGITIIGRFGDTHERNATLTLTIMTMVPGTAIVGVLPGYAGMGMAALVLLVVPRLIEEFSAGGETGRSTAFMAECAPHGDRGGNASFHRTSTAICLGPVTTTLKIVGVEADDGPENIVRAFDRGLKAHGRRHVQCAFWDLEPSAKLRAVQ